MKSIVADLFVAILPLLGVLAGLIVCLILASGLINRFRDRLGRKRTWIKHLVLGAIWLIGVMSILLTLPIPRSTQGHLIALMSLVVTVAVTLSSTTFVANAMAGLMMRVTRAFRTGDFVEIGEHFGRVTERGLLHTELQTDERDFNKIPNLYLVNHPMTVIRGAETVISATIDLSYTLVVDRVVPVLKASAKRSGLHNPFVHITELGTNAVTYRVYGVLSDTGRLLTARSDLRMQILGGLLAAGMEVSIPAVVINRSQKKQNPAKTMALRDVPISDPKATVETILFDKADAARRLEDLQDQAIDLQLEIVSIRKEMGLHKDLDERAEFLLLLQSRAQSLRAVEHAITHLQNQTALADLKVS